MAKNSKNIQNPDVSITKPFILRQSHTALIPIGYCEVYFSCVFQNLVDVFEETENDIGGDGNGEQVVN